MTLPTTLRFDLTDPDVKQLTGLKALPIAAASDEVFESFMAAQETMLELKYTSPSDTGQNPTYNSYATVVVDGKIVAKIDNHGWVESSNAIGGKIQNDLPMRGAGGELSGPALAEARAAYMAERLGGTIEMSSTALSQREFNAIPQPTMTVDRAAMMRDPAYQNLQELSAQRTAFLAQQIAQESKNTGALLTTPVTNNQNDGMENTTTKSAAEEFLEYMAMTPEERYFDAFLKRHNLTQEAFDALPPEDKEDLLSEFEEELKQSAVIAQDEKERKDRGE